MGSSLSSILQLDRTLVSDTYQPARKQNCHPTLYEDTASGGNTKLFTKITIISKQ